MNAIEFSDKIESGEAKVLTLDNAKKLKGKEIEWMYFGYERNENKVRKMVVGDIVSEFDHYKKEPIPGFASRSDYWLSFMSDKRIFEVKNTFILLDEKGNDNSHIYCNAYDKNYFDVPTFTCSDADREVYYIELSHSNINI